MDPYISRLNYGSGGHPDDDRPHFAREDLAWSDTTLIDSLITEADFILCTHSHFDHLADVPYIARKTGAKVIGHETANTILRAYGIPDEQLYTVRGGEDYQFEDFSVRVVPSLHSALNEKLYYDSRRYDEQTDLEAPAPHRPVHRGGHPELPGTVRSPYRAGHGRDELHRAGVRGPRTGHPAGGHQRFTPWALRLRPASAYRHGVPARGHSRPTGTTSGTPTGFRSRRTSNGISSRSSRPHDHLPGNDRDHPVHLEPIRIR